MRDSFPAVWRMGCWQASLTADADDAQRADAPRARWRFTDRHQLPPIPGIDPSAVGYLGRQISDEVHIAILLRGALAFVYPGERDTPIIESVENTRSGITMAGR